MADANQNEFPRIELRSIFPHIEELTISGSAQLLADAKQFLAHYKSKGLCKVNFTLKSDDVSLHIGKMTTF